MRSLLKESERFWSVWVTYQEMVLERLKVVLFWNVFHQMFVCIHEPPIDDFGGRGPSSNVLKQKAQNNVTTAKLLGTLLKESEQFWSVWVKYQEMVLKRLKVVLFLNFFTKCLFGLMSPRSVILGVADPPQAYLSKKPKIVSPPQNYWGLY